ncbi:hypothetical protein GDO81_027143 [Engystomops pustulosus]|uniref:RNase H type-1 domain-containing protein n=1 Tax=Engystomops pustulosus TaxID=76066 RepID=A0AAV6YQM1_ENGPU|nr:hypothetical protein GDO81_027143 [Engystomops pustulosus]
MIVQIDASQLVWGANVAGHPIQGQWPKLTKSRSSNYRELRVMLETLRVSTLKDQHVRIYTENITTVAYLCHHGGTRNPDLLSLSEKIFYWSENNVCSFSATHLKGEENQVPDHLSRQIIDQNECCINDIFMELTQKWGLPTINL